MTTELRRSPAPSQPSRQTREETGEGTRARRLRMPTLASDTADQELVIRAMAFLGLIALWGWNLRETYIRYWEVLTPRETLEFFLQAVLAIPVVFAIATSVHILPQWERGVVLFLGQHLRWYLFPYPFSLYKGWIPTPFFFTGNRGPGLVFTIPIFETMVRVSTRDRRKTFKAAQTQTRDQAPVDAEGMGFWSIDPSRPHLSVLVGEDTNDLVDGAINLSAKAALGKYDLDTAVEDKKTIADYMIESIEPLTDRWGVLMHDLSFSDVVITIPEVQRRIAEALEAKYAAGALLQAAKIERQAAEENQAAALIYQENPQAWHIRQLQALERLVEKGKAVLVPSEALGRLGTLGAVVSMQTALEPDEGSTPPAQHE